MKRLILVLKIQAVVFLVYGLSFLLAPDFTLDTVFGWSGADTLFPRMVGATFLALAWFDWLVARRIEWRLDLVWPLVLAPVLLLVTLVGVRIADNYPGTDLFYWVSIAVTVFFAATVGWSRIAVGKSEPPIPTAT